jgi:outer membrane protein assembly factor BamB
MYNGPDSGQLAECDNCGAHLPPPDERGIRTCTFCKAVYSPAAPKTTAPPAVNVVINAPGFSNASYTAEEFKPINQPKTKSGCGCGLLVLLIIVASIGIPVFIAFSNGGFKLPNFTNYQFGAEVLPLPGEPNKPIAFLAASRRYDSGKTLWKVLKVNGVDTKPVWESADLTSTTEPIFIQQGSFAYVVSGTSLLALKQSDGSVAWQATLSDEYSKSDCAECFAVVGPTVVVKTKDDAIQAFNATAGASAWTHQIESSSGKMYRTDTKVVLLDEHVDEQKHRQTSLTTFDPATGTPLVSFAPECVNPKYPTSKTQLSTSDIVQRSTRHPESLYVAFGSSPGCLQLWDMNAGTMATNLYIPDISFSTSGFSLVDAEEGVLVANYGTVGFAWFADGHFQPLAQVDSSQFLAMAVTGDVAIVNTKSSRGSTKTSLQGYDLVSGAKKWDVNMGAATSIDGPNETSFSSSYDGTFTAHVSDGRVNILLFTEGRSKDHSMETFSVDATTGAPGSRVALDAKTTDLIPSFGPANWTGGKVVIRVGDDTIQVIDVANAKTDFTMP